MITDETVVAPEIGAAPAWRVYGIVPAGSRLPDLGERDGVDLARRRPQLLVHGGLAAVVEPVETDRSIGREDLLAHSALLNALVEQGPVVPVSFGAAFTERDQVVQELLAEPDLSPSVAALLDELRGHAQFQLTVRYSIDDLLAQIVAADAEIEAARERMAELADGAGYGAKIRLGERISDAVESQQAEDTDWVLGRTAECTQDSRLSSSSASGGTVSLAFLVADAHRPAFEAAAEEAAERMHARAVVELRGPLAAFDFVPRGW